LSEAVNLVACDACGTLTDEGSSRKVRHPRKGEVPLCRSCSQALDAMLPPEVLEALGRPPPKWGVDRCGSCNRRFRLSTSRGSLYQDGEAHPVCPRCSDAFDAQAARALGVA